ncbi:hypothetical protein G9A89_014416 [Geosiphon pyriformis]|nr:hypothetical protein G9A89_014416 [Geosiphon pyriformis]
MKLTPAIFAKHAIENDLDSQKEVKNGTTYLALHVEIYYQKNTTGLIRRTPFNAVYNSAFNKLYHYPYDAKMIFDLAMALINRATQEDVHQIKKAEYNKYTMKLAGFDYEDEVETYHQIAKQMNIQLCEECIMPCDDQKCLECYAFSIPLLDKNDENEIKFGVSELIDAEYDLRYSGKDTLILQPKSLTKINFKIAFEILPEAIVQIAFRLLLTSKGINIKGRVIDTEYIRDITIMLQNETEKPFKIEHAKEIAQAIYLPLINILVLQVIISAVELNNKPITWCLKATSVDDVW